MGTRGYHSYRGRGSTGKKVLAIVLGVILVAAGAFLLLQNRYVVYDENGNAHWELPFAFDDDSIRFHSLMFLNSSLNERSTKISF